MRPQVFVSYAENDKNIGEVLRRLLEDQGLTVNVVSEGLCTTVPGRECSKMVEQALNKSDLVVALITKDSVYSAWMNQELGFAIGADKPTILFVEGDVPVSGLYGGRQYIRFGADGLGKVATTLSKALSELGITPKMKIIKGAKRPFS